MYNWITQNWYLCIGAIALVVTLGIVIYKFLGLPTKEQVSKIKEWLLYAVVEAEKELGSKTGILKLRMVFDMFITRFPLVAKVVTFDTFSIWVDDALVKMKELLENNDNVKAFIEIKR